MPLMYGGYPPITLCLSFYSDATPKCSEPRQGFESLQIGGGGPGRRYSPALAVPTASDWLSFNGYLTLLFGGLSLEFAIAAVLRSLANGTRNKKFMAVLCLSRQ